MRSVLLAAGLTAACFFAMVAQPIPDMPLIAPAAPGLQSEQAVAREIAEDVQPLAAHEAERAKRDDLQAAALERNAQRAAAQRANDDARRRAIVHQRAMVAAQRRKARLAATEHLPIARPTVDASPMIPYQLPPPIIIPPSPGDRTFISIGGDF